MTNNALNQDYSSALTGHVEVYCIFDGKTIVSTISATEFDALLEHESALEGRHGKVYLAHVIANPKQFIQSIVLFILPLDDKGYVVDGWRLPLERLSNTANRGPNLGGGRIRLSCYSQCSISWHQDSLWDPGARHFTEIKKAVEGYLTELEEDLEPLDLNDIDEGKDANLDGVDQLKRELRNEAAAYRNELQELQQEVERQRLLNDRLLRKLNDHAGGSALIPQADKVDLQVLRRQNEQLNMKLRELQIKNENLRSERSGDQSSSNISDDMVEKMAQQEMMSVVYHHGVGHINLTPHQIADYLEDPIAYAANHIDISKLQYKRWLDHEKNPKCQVCDDELVVVADPSIFDFEVDVYCDQHKP